jgi:hypothetical protein
MVEDRRLLSVEGSDDESGCAMGMGSEPPVKIPPIASAGNRTKGRAAGVDPVSSACASALLSGALDEGIPAAGLPALPLLPIPIPAATTSTPTPPAAFSVTKMDVPQ